MATMVQRLREAQLLAKAELARRAGVSESTIDRIEAGRGCRMETKRKILFALGLTLADGKRVFQRNKPLRNGGRNGGGAGQAHTRAGGRRR